MTRNVWTKLRWTLPVALCAAFWPSWALASAGPGRLSAAQSRILILLAIVGVAYLITHLVLERIAQRYGFVTGVEYIVLGVILGPVLGVLDASTVSALTPAVVLGTGSLGLLAGLHIDLRAFRDPQTGELRRRALQSAVFIAVATLVCVTGVATAILYGLWTPAGVAHVMPLLLCMGAVAMVAGTGALRAMATHLGAEGRAADFGVEVARYCSSIAIFAFGLIFCLYNATAVPFQVDPTIEWLVWLGIHLLLGVVLGLIFTTFLRRDLSDDKIMTVIIGMVIFTSGFAYYLQLSPIFVNFILGVVLTNICRHADHVESRLTAIRRPLYIVLFFFAGAAWTLDAPLWGYSLVLVYVVLRRAGRVAGSVIATRVLSIRSWGAGLSRALLAPGALSVAMLLNFNDIFNSPEHVSALVGGVLTQVQARAELAYLDVLYNGLLIAIVLVEIFSYPLTRGWLIDVADVTPPEQRKNSPRNAEVS